MDKKAHKSVCSSTLVKLIIKRGIYRSPLNRLHHTTNYTFSLGVVPKNSL